MIPRATPPNKALERQRTILFKRILLVENDPVLREEICDFLDLQFYDVTVAPTGAEAIRQLLGNNYDVLVCDLTMKDFPGEMFYEGVRRIRPALCKSFISINSATQTAAAARTMGLMSIWKPIDLQVLLETIETVLKKNERLAQEAEDLLNFDAR